MQITSKWMDSICSMATDEASHNVVMKDSATEGCVGRNPGPMGMLLMGVAGCSSTDVIMIVEEQRQDITGYQAAVMAKCAKEPPRVSTGVHIHFVVTKCGLKTDAAKQTVRLSAEKYCSAPITLGKTAKITHSFRIVEV